MYVNESQRMPQGHEGIPTQEHLGQAVIHFFGPPLPVAQAGKRPGAPRQISQTHLWMSLLLCVLQGMCTFQQWRRLVCTQVGGGRPPIQLTDDALIKRLEQAGVKEVQQLFEQVSGWSERRFGHVWSTRLSPIALEMLAIDLLHTRPDLSASAPAARFSQWRRALIGWQSGRAVRCAQASVESPLLPGFGVRE